MRMSFYEIAKKGLKSLFGERPYLLLKDSRFFVFSWRYERHIKKLRHKAISGHTIKVDFFIEYPEVWNSLKSIYDEMISRTEFDVQIVTFPKSKEVIEEGEAKNCALEFFHKNNIECSDCVTYGASGRIPDYVFYTRPYVDEYAVGYRPAEMGRKARVCHVPYGISTMLAENRNSYNDPFLMTAYLLFIDSDVASDYLNKRIKRQINRRTKKVINVGNPRYDLAKNCDFPPPVLDLSEKPLQVLWMPRWATSNNSFLTSFFDFKDNLFSYCMDSPRLELVCRFHPKALVNYYNEGLLSKEEIDALLDVFERPNNLVLDKNEDYYPAMRSADILVADWTTLISEYLASGKPIVYCGELGQFHSDYLFLADVMYKVGSWKELEQVLDKLTSGEDPLREKRLKAVEKYRNMMDENVGSAIAKAVYDDYFEK